MPLLKSKALSKAPEAKPSAQSLAIAYNMRRHAGGKKAHTGAAEEESRPGSIAEAIRMQKQKPAGYAEGGEVEEDTFDDTADLSMFDDGVEAAEPEETEELPADRISAIRQRMKASR